ncbi:prenyltransferase/squalene oxidase repeat-containing protein [Inediibacterium massiliense]|uniref:prenyltransferase/squalene oxidase repeat-containing protein n=1 Tax=Inediibacterium massiliense TaxID=1658111 RepID=UPI0006B657D1|nr:hypothetical protein [Inediibacterium massiliense]
MKKIISFVLLFTLLFSSFSFALDINSAAKYLNKQKIDEWGILALYSSGKSVKGKALKNISSKVTTDYEAYIMGALPLGRNVSKEAQIIMKSQRSTGKFADFIDGTGEDLMNSHIWGIIALYCAKQENYNKQNALLWLKQNQNKDGGFPVYKGDPESDIDLTSMAIIAYHILGLNENSKEVKSALSFIQKNIGKRESCESISYYILAKTKLGMKVEKSLYDQLGAYQLKNGGFKHFKKQTKENYMASWHGLLAMTDYKNKKSIFTRLHEKNK